MRGDQKGIHKIFWKKKKYQNQEHQESRHTIGALCLASLLSQESPESRIDLPLKLYSNVSTKCNSR